MWGKKKKEISRINFASQVKNMQIIPHLISIYIYTSVINMFIAPDDVDANRTEGRGCDSSGMVSKGFISRQSCSQQDKLH